MNEENKNENKTIDNVFNLPLDNNDNNVVRYIKNHKNIFFILITVIISFKMLIIFVINSIKWLIMFIIGLSFFEILLLFLIIVIFYLVINYIIKEGITKKILIKILSKIGFQFLFFVLFTLLVIFLIGPTEKEVKFNELLQHMYEKHYIGGEIYCVSRYLKHLSTEDEICNVTELSCPSLSVFMSSKELLRVMNLYKIGSEQLKQIIDYTDFNWYKATILYDKYIHNNFSDEKFIKDQLDSLLKLNEFIPLLNFVKKLRKLCNPQEKKYIKL